MAKTTPPTPAELAAKNRRDAMAYAYVNADGKHLIVNAEGKLVEAPADAKLLSAAQQEVAESVASIMLLKRKVLALNPAEQSLLKKVQEGGKEAWDKLTGPEKTSLENIKKQLGLDVSLPFEETRSEIAALFSLPGAIWTDGKNKYYKTKAKLGNSTVELEEALMTGVAFASAQAAAQSELPKNVDAGAFFKGLFSNDFMNYASAGLSFLADKLLNFVAKNNFLGLGNWVKENYPPDNKTLAQYLQASSSEDVNKRVAAELQKVPTIQKDVAELLAFGGTMRLPDGLEATVNPADGKSNAPTGTSHATGEKLPATPEAAAAAAAELEKNKSAVEQAENDAPSATGAAVAKLGVASVVVAGGLGAAESKWKLIRKTVNTFGVDFFSGAVRWTASPLTRATEILVRVERGITNAFMPTTENLVAKAEKRAVKLEKQVVKVASAQLDADIAEGKITVTEEKPKATWLEEYKNELRTQKQQAATAKAGPGSALTQAANEKALALAEQTTTAKATRVFDNHQVRVWAETQEPQVKAQVLKELGKAGWFDRAKIWMGFDKPAGAKLEAALKASLDTHLTSEDTVGKRQAFVTNAVNEKIAQVKPMLETRGGLSRFADWGLRPLSDVVQTGNNVAIDALKVTRAAINHGVDHVQQNWKFNTLSAKEIDAAETKAMAKNLNQGNGTAGQAEAAAAHSAAKAAAPDATTQTANSGQNAAKPAAQPTGLPSLESKPTRLQAAQAAWQEFEKIPAAMREQERLAHIANRKANNPKLTPAAIDEAVKAKAAHQATAAALKAEMNGPAFAAAQQELAAAQAEFTLAAKTTAPAAGAAPKLAVVPNTAPANPAAPAAPKPAASPVAQRLNSLRANVDNLVAAVANSARSLVSQPAPGAAPTASLYGSSVYGVHGNAVTIQQGKLELAQELQPVGKAHPAAANVSDIAARNTAAGVQVWRQGAPLAPAPAQPVTAAAPAAQMPTAKPATPTISKTGVAIGGLGVVMTGVGLHGQLREGGLHDQAKASGSQARVDAERNVTAATVAMGATSGVALINEGGKLLPKAVTPGLVPPRAVASAVASKVATPILVAYTAAELKAAMLAQDGNRGAETLGSIAGGVAGGGLAAAVTLNPFVVAGGMLVGGYVTSKAGKDSVLAKNLQQDFDLRAQVRIDASIQALRPLEAKRRVGQKLSTLESEFIQTSQKQAFGHLQHLDWVAATLPKGDLDAAKRIAEQQKQVQAILDALDGGVEKRPALPMTSFEAKIAAGVKPPVLSAQVAQAEQKNLRAYFSSSQGHVVMEELTKAGVGKKLGMVNGEVNVLEMAKLCKELHITQRELSRGDQPGVSFSTYVQNLLVVHGEKRIALVEPKATELAETYARVVAEAKEAAWRAAAETQFAKEFQAPLNRQINGQYLIQEPMKQAIAALNAEGIGAQLGIQGRPLAAHDLVNKGVTKAALEQQLSQGKKPVEALKAVLKDLHVLVAAPKMTMEQLGAAHAAVIAQAKMTTGAGNKTAALDSTTTKLNLGEGPAFATAKVSIGGLNSSIPAGSSGTTNPRANVAAGMAAHA